MRGRPWLRFAVIATGLFVVLVTLTQSGLYPPYFRGLANTFLSGFGDDRIARFEAIDDAGGIFDTRMSLGIRIGGQESYPTGTNLSSFRQGFLPTALGLALIVATPMARRRHLWAIGTTWVLVHLFVALRLTSTALYGFTRVGIDERRLLEVPKPIGWLLERGDQILAGDLHMSYLAPLLIWIAVVACFADFAWLTPKRREA